MHTPTIPSLRPTHIPSTLSSSQYATSRNIRKAINAYFDLSEWHNPHAVTLTLKKGVSSQICHTHAHVKLTTQDASQNMRHFLNLLNRRLFGQAAKRYAKRTRVITVIEGSEWTGLHIHCVIDCPLHYNPVAFPLLIETLWRQTQWGHKQIDIQPNASKGWIEYISKLRSKPDYADAFDWQNTYILDCRV